MSEIAIRAATLFDAQNIAGLLHDSFDWAYPDFKPIYTTQDYLEFVRSVLLKHWMVELATEDRHLLGVIAYSTTEVSQLYVDPSHLRQGIGTQLLRRAQTAADALTLWTFAVNEDALEFYGSHGFQEIARTDGDNDRGEPDVQLEWRRP